MRKWTIRQFEWYRDNKKLLPSQAQLEAVLFFSWHRKCRKREEKDYEKKNVSNRSSSSNQYDDGFPGNGR